MVVAEEHDSKKIEVVCEEKPNIDQKLTEKKMEVDDKSEEKDVEDQPGEACPKEENGDEMSNKQKSENYAMEVDGNEEKPNSSDVVATDDKDEKPDNEETEDKKPEILKPSKKVHTDTIEVEEFYVKFKNL